jgi:uncharacterized phage protein (TIGR01671 family)
MREIKFRGYDKELNIMTYFNDDIYILQYGDILRQYIDDIDDFGNPEFSYESAKNTVELMQFTGLHDKNGKEIYEGDIVYIIPEDENGKVEWDNESARFVVVYNNIVTDFDNWYGADLEVVGNIYDNSELLEK